MCRGIFNEKTVTQSVTQNVLLLWYKLCVTKRGYHGRMVLFIWSLEVAL